MISLTFFTDAQLTDTFERNSRDYAQTHFVQETKIYVNSDNSVYYGKMLLSANPLNMYYLKNYIRKVEYSHETKKTRSRKNNEAHVKQKKKE